MTYSAPLFSQVYDCAVFLGVGFLLGLLFELCRFMRLLFAGESNAAVAAQDVVFCVLSFFVLFFSFLAFSSGILRLPFLVFAAVGFLSFRFTLCPPLRRLLAKCSAGIRKAGLTCLRPLFWLSDRSKAALSALKNRTRRGLSDFRRRKKQKTVKKDGVK